MTTNDSLDKHAEEVEGHGKPARGMQDAGEVEDSARVLPSIAQEANPLAPRFPVATPLVQAMLTTRRPAGVEVMDRHSGALLVDGGADEWPDAGDATVKMLAYYTPASVNAFVPARMNGLGNASRGLVILLHGWEGCSHSIFNLTLGSALVRAGYDVVRLNLRDHGPTARIDPIYLNEGLFLGTFLGEVRRAVANVAAMRRGGPVYLVGASLGGNYALRLASQDAEGPDSRQSTGLDGVIAVSPVVDPAQSIDLIDLNYPFRQFFRARWISTLRRKAAAFPHRYNFDGIERLSRIRPMTEWMVRRYTPFASADAYLGSYTYLDGASRALNTPTTILASVDDPVIPVEDIYGLADSPYLTRRILGWGGHAGLIEWPPLRHRMPELILDILSGAG